VPDLIAAIENYMAVHNSKPKPFVWTATADAAPVGGPISLPDRPVSEHAARARLIDAGVPVETAGWRGRPGRS